MLHTFTYTITNCYAQRSQVHIMNYICPFDRFDRLYCIYSRVVHICISKIITIDSDNGLSPDRHQAIIWTNAGILLLGPLGTNVSEIMIDWSSYIFIQQSGFETRLRNGGHFVQGEEELNCVQSLCDIAYSIGIQKVEHHYLNSQKASHIPPS